MDSRVLKIPVFVLLKIPMFVLLMSDGKWKLISNNISSKDGLDLIINCTQEEMHDSLKLSLFLVKLNPHILNCP